MKVLNEPPTLFITVFPYYFDEPVAIPLESSQAYMEHVTLRATHEVVDVSRMNNVDDRRI